MENISDLDHISNLTNITNITTQSNGKKNYLHFSSSSNHLSAKFLWNIIGSKLEVYSFEQRCNNRLVASFDFGQIFNDPNIIITNVSRLVDRLEFTSQYRHPHKLIVILNLTNSRNYICIVNIRLNSIVNTIDFPFNITCIEVILSGPKERVQNMPLINELCGMNGCLAVGCESGLVFFIDLILDSYSSEPLIPKKISLITHNSAHIEIKNKRRTAIFHNQVICISLNIEAKNKGKFNYRADDGTILASFHINQVYISALYYIPQLSLICVGYNFGGFHLYNLNLFTLECSCNVDSDLLPVISFAYQAPENDPKNYSYLWVVRGVWYRIPNLDEQQVPINSLSSAFIYLLCYQNKRIIENYGLLYDTFKLCRCKFELPLSCNYEGSINLNCSSRLLDMFTIHQILPSKSLEDEEIQIYPIDYNYLIIAWETVEKNHFSSNFYFCIFDLNQWYRFQMTKNFCVNNDGLCPFISLYSLNSLAKIFHDNSIQAIYFPNISMTKFSSNIFYSDIHSYPASLSFNMTVVSGSQICNVSYYGLQKRMISYLNSCGLKILLENCQNILIKCVKCGLISNEHSIFLNESSIDDTKLKLFQLMNIALENNLNSLLVNFIKDSLYLDSNLEMIIEWIWNKVESIKSSIDLLTKPLFDLSGCNVSRQDISKLVCYESHLGTLAILLRQLLEKSITFTNLDFDKLKARIEVVELIRHYLKFILFFENFGLLPEQEDSENSNDDRPIYPYEKLSKFYCKRREDFVSIKPKLLQSQEILLIDILVKQLEPHLSNIWKIKESNKNNFSRLYPPEDISSLLQIFLLDSLPMIYKESVLLYFIYDLRDCLSKYPCITQKLLIFISSLNIQQGIRNFIEGLWFLDHQNYEPALQLFIHPMVTISLNDFKADIKLFNKLLQKIIESFLFENYFKKAMILMMSCNHILLDKEQNEYLYIQILLLNGNLSGALEFQRHRRSESHKSYDLLNELFFFCEKMNFLIQLCQMPLDNFEEKVFIQYLLKSSHSNAKMILILYFIMNNKLIEAIQFAKEFEKELNNNEDNKNILSLIEAYVTVLPSSSLCLAKEITKMISDNEFNDKDPSLVPLDVSQSSQKISRTSFLRKESIKEPLYLSPGLSKCRINKMKHQNPVRHLFAILKTPDTKRKIISNIDSISKKSILKLGISNENESTEGQKLKVSFLNEEKVNDQEEGCSNDDEANEKDIIEDQSSKKEIKTTFSTPIAKKSRITKKTPIDSPTHRMTLRSNKKN